MHQHLLAQHPGWGASTVQGRELQDFRDKIAITEEEESKLRIPEPKQGLYCLDIPAMRHSNPMLLPQFAIGVASQDALISPIQLPVPLNLHRRSLFLIDDVFF